MAAAFDQLKAAFPTKVVTPNAASEYEAAVAVPWSQTCWTPAAGYIYLSNVQELTKALAIVKKTGSKFSIRTTGHNNGFVAVGLLYGDTPAERPAAFDPFFNLTSLISTALPTPNDTLLSLAEAMGHAQDSQKQAH